MIIPGEFLASNSRRALQRDAGNPSVVYAKKGIEAGVVVVNLHCLEPVSTDNQWTRRNT
jgi:hypothetical protein